VDRELPGIDGPTVIRRIRLDPALRRMPCLLLTASDDRTAELQALEAGADAFLRKGDLSLVLAKLAATLRGVTAIPAGGEVDGLSGPKRILAVDDSRTYLATIGAALRDEGYEVILASSGEEACELLARQPVDCILLDLIMPGLSGRDTCRRIKAAPVLQNIPVIMLTAVEDADAVIECLAAGADDFIQKSSEFEILGARVRAQIRRKLFEDENRRVRDELLRAELDAAQARAASELAAVRGALIDELEQKNDELQAFSSSVSHDLRNPLQAVLGFGQLLVEDYTGQIDETGGYYLRQVLTAAQRMSQIIDDLLQLSHVSGADLTLGPVDLSAMARASLDELRGRDPARQVTTAVADGAIVLADTGLMRVLMDNLLGNAWKYSSKTDAARIEFGWSPEDGAGTCFVRDNGAGFDMAHADALFVPFRRLHDAADFPGTGIGLATVHRVIDRHGGRIWAEGTVHRGATFYFAIPSQVAGAGAAPQAAGLAR
jgi:signal transduction histidine kinase